MKKFKWIVGKYTGGYKGNEPKIVKGFQEAIDQLAEDKFAYIHMPFDDSLNGYVILKIKLDDLGYQNWDAQKSLEK